MKRAILTLAIAAAVSAGFAGPVDASPFGLTGLEVSSRAGDGSPQVQAGSHPFALTTNLEAQTEELPLGSGEQGVGEEAKDVSITFPPGLVGDPTAVPRCPISEFLPNAGGTALCPATTAVGVAELEYQTGAGPAARAETAVYNLPPAPGSAAKIGFVVEGISPVVIDIGLNRNPPYNLIATSSNILQGAVLRAARVVVWGVPAASTHDSLRGACVGSGLHGGTMRCPVNLPAIPFLTLPTECARPLSFGFEADSWQQPTSVPYPFQAAVAIKDDQTPPNPLSASGCAKLGFSPTIGAKPTTLAASSPTGLDFSLDVADEGILNPEGLSQSDVEQAVVTLPEGFTTNPSLAEGLNVCTTADLARETAFSAPGAGCPSESKIGTVEVETPLLEEKLDGALFAAKPYENLAGNSLLALYMVIKNPTLGIIIKQPLKVETNETTGQITTVAENLPQLPFSHFKLHFREGTRSPLASPPACGKYDGREISPGVFDPKPVQAVLTPWSGGAPITTTSAFSIIVGPESGPCPSGGTPPFHPGLEAGSINNAAGAYSPFYLHLTRKDSEQEITHFSIKLPPGLLGKLAGIPFCSDAAIEAAKARTGPHGGQEELEHPSCPAASEVGHTLVGAGVGPSLAYAPGKVYLAGPYHGSQLSIAAITAAKVGPFDLGTVVVREALKINPETAEVFIDATGSDPIPRIIKGIPVHLRDIRVYVDRPDFTLNPTSCAPTSTASTVLGSGTNFGSEADDQPVTVTSRFQAADCASLGFAPKLALSLKGGTKRNQVPAFKAVLTYPKGAYANIAKAQVTLPKSVFLDNEHIETICTRPVFNEGAVPGEKCPAASVYGHAQAITPLLGEPIEGPVYLRANGGERQLPDLVAALHSGKININLVGYIDSVHKKGSEVSRIRNTFAQVPDAPVTKFTLEMAGGKKGLLINSTNLCKSTNRALAAFAAHNGKQSNFEPVLKPLGCKGKAKQSKRAKRSRLLTRVGW